MLEEILAYNANFVKNGEYVRFATDKYPNKKIAVLTCMDTRLVELLPAAMGYKNGDIKILKNAGGVISHPFGSVMRSLIIAIYELCVDTIWVIGHTDCGMENLDVDKLMDKMIARGIDPGTIEGIEQQGIDYNNWLAGMDSVQASVIKTMGQIHDHPLIPQDIQIEGLLMDSFTGKLTPIHTFNAVKHP